MRQRLIALFAFLSVTLTAGSAAAAGSMVGFAGYAPGTIVIVTSQRVLYLAQPGGMAIRYPVGVGKAGQAWHGAARIAAKDLRPSWAPPYDIAMANPARAKVFPGGSPGNPMGAAAMGLTQGNYAIHGTNDERSVGHFVSHGCIRMYNADVLDLYQRVSVGTPVVVLP